MKKLLFVFHFSFFILHFSFSQTPGEWVWMKGDSTPNSLGNYGTQGIPSPTNKPPAMYEGNQFTDTSGRFWLLGGSWGGSNFWADLWEYDPATNIWTWMKGPGTVNYLGNFGTKGIPAASNCAPYEVFGASSWVDLNGDLWTFGGWTAFSDMWRYHIATNEWTWMNGPGTTNQTGVYGTQGVADPANHPGYRWESAANWTDNNGNLWLFGGYNGSVYNDLWKYDISTNEWVWMKGSNIPNVLGVYGTRGVEAAANTPGARGAYCNWKDNNGYLWFFAAGWQPQNDLWRYNIATNNWTWMSGDTLNQSVGYYGTKCVSTTSTTPGIRRENRAHWVDNNGNLWAHGGDYSNFSACKNDLWMYSTVTNQWKWVSGDTINNPPGLWGTQGVSAPANRPNGRCGNIGWYDGHCHLYMYGGGNSGLGNEYNDLWIYTIDSTCGGGCSQSVTIPQAGFDCSDTTFCSETGECINFFDHSTGNPTSWQWSFPGASPSSSTLQNPDSICYTTPGTYPVQLIVGNGSTYDTLNVSPLIIFGSAPAPPTIILIGGDTLVSSNGASYQWYYNGAPIAGATDSFYVEHQSGTYAVQITDVTGGCNSISNGFTITGVGELNSNDDIYIYPNPASQSITIAWQSAVRGDIAITITNVLAEKVYSQQLQTLNSKLQTFDISAFSKGVYIVELINGDKIYRTKFIKN